MYRHSYGIFLCLCGLNACMVSVNLYIVWFRASTPCTNCMTTQGTLAHTHCITIHKVIKHTCMPIMACVLWSCHVNGTHQVTDPSSLVCSALQGLAEQYAAVPMLSRTHGQTASPTTMGKEMANVAYRLARQRHQVGPKFRSYIPYMLVLCQFRVCILHHTCWCCVSSSAESSQACSCTWVGAPLPCATSHSCAQISRCVSRCWYHPCSGCMSCNQFQSPSLLQLKDVPIYGKMAGAVGNYNAHISAYPDVKWDTIADQFVSSLGLQLNPYVTQVGMHRCACTHSVCC